MSNIEYIGDIFDKPSIQVQVEFKVFFKIRFFNHPKFLLEW